MGRRDASFTFIRKHNLASYDRGRECPEVEYYFVWIGVDFVASFLWFFFGVETVGRTIEELDACFEAKFSPKVSWKRTKIVKSKHEEIGVRVADLGAWGIVTLADVLCRVWGMED
ncbi:hypothetical protein BDZ45DRAFT_764567 [Acephala macrosclerotiorum]|nr:hypothetical protein BDZ45DRAFT_764567 [Acephala macrosclerotiorum]